MKKRSFYIYVVSLLLCSMALAEEVKVYRAVDYKNATYAKINDAQWRVDPDGVSTFEKDEFNVDNKACQVYFVIENVSSKPAPGTTGHIKNMPGAYLAKYTPEPDRPGHWSIPVPQGHTAEGLKSAITDYVIQQKVAEKNPNYKGSSKSQCQTPAQPN
jgi:hypothetical protein